MGKDIIKMEISHIQQLTEKFGPQDTLEFKFDTLMDIVDHFCMDYNEELKKGLEKDLVDKLKSLISEYETKVTRLKHAIETLRHSY